MASFSRYLREAADLVGTLPIAVDWPALAVAIGGPAVGIAGVVFGWLQSRGERDNARELVELQNEHSRQAVSSERMFEARSEAYDALLRQLHTVMMIIERTEPMIGPTSPPPEQPSEDDWTDMYVRIAMFGSPELNEAFREFGKQWAAFLANALFFVE